jgi:FkbM family methyltransferase
MNFQHGWAFPDADEFMKNEIKADGSYQGGHLAAALKYVTDWSCAIDGGAHVGTWSRTMSGRFGQVIAIEPSADTREALLVNLQAFGCANVDVRGVALGDKPGTVVMTLDGRGADLKNTGARYARAGGGDVSVVTIDSWQLPSLGLLKLDIEGSEVVALRGAVETLQRCKPVVIYEDKYLWKRYAEPRDACETVLLSVGYKLAEVVKCDRVWVPA